MMQKKLMMSSLLLIICIAVSFLGGCTKAPPRKAGDELVRHRWIMEDQQNRRCTLTFTDGQLCFCAGGFGEEVEMKGDCFVQEKQMTVLSEEYGTVCFGYSLVGDRLELTFCGKSVTLKKQDKPENFVQN